jgi:hypothetical protein
MRFKMDNETQKAINTILGGFAVLFVVAIIGMVL